MEDIIISTPLGFWLVTGATAMGILNSGFNIKFHKESKKEKNLTEITEIKTKVDKIESDVKMILQHLIDK